MKICGIKLTHDAAVAGIEDGKLVFSVEIEKLKNNPRYSKMESLEDIQLILDQFNFKPDIFVVDGWKHGRAAGLPSATYHEFDGEPGVLARRTYNSGLVFGGYDHSYESYKHMAGHLIGSYAASPFAKAGEPAYIISWDGGQNPRLHYINPKLDIINYGGSLFEFYGMIYGLMGYYWGPYKDAEIAKVEDVDGLRLFGRRDWPGKLMAYIALGETCKPLLDQCEHFYNKVCLGPSFSLGYEQRGVIEHAFVRLVDEWVRNNGTDLSDADVLCTIHDFLEGMLVRKAKEYTRSGCNLIFTGGSALNIKWNSALRECGHFADVFVPPFCNDSGSAIGAACCAMVRHTGNWALDWSAYAGMPIMPSQPLPGWSAGEPCSIASVAQILADEPTEPIVFLNGRCEIGPRALGNRSILMSPCGRNNQFHLNHIKRREQFRPVSPICMEEHASKFFTPGTPDPYMLFDHFVRDDKRDVIPAVIHIDGTSRLQTVNAEQNPVVHELLSEFYNITGIPLLCNTSANLNGSGFFPDVASAMLWDGAKRVWCDGMLYTKES